VISYKYLQKCSSESRNFSYEAVESLLFSCLPSEKAKVHKTEVAVVFGRNSSVVVVTSYAAVTRRHLEHTPLVIRSFPSGVKLGPSSVCCAFFVYMFYPSCLANRTKSKTIPVTGRGGLYSCEMLRIPHCLDSWLTDGGEVVTPTHWPCSTTLKLFSEVQVEEKK
jgi:hypothetical protein